MPETGQHGDDGPAGWDRQVLDSGLDGLEVRNEFSGRAQAIVQAGFIHQVVQTLPPQTRPRPHQVPAGLASFGNQVEPLAWLQAAMPTAIDTAPQIVVFYGPRGAGKTAIVRQFAPAVRDRFTGGQFFADFGVLDDDEGARRQEQTVRDRRTASASDVLARFLRALNIPDGQIPVTLVERASLFRTLTADAPVLVVLDDVRLAEQVRSLVPNSSGSVVLVTGDTFTNLGELLMDGAKIIELKRLSGGEALALMSAQCGSDRLEADPGATTELVRLCDGLSVALAVAATRLARNPRMSVTDLVRELTDESERLRALSIGKTRVVDVVFGTVYRNLQADAARMYVGLGLLPGRSFSLETAAISAGMPVGPAAAAVEALAADHLIEAQEVDTQGSSRWLMHGLVRAHATDLARLEENRDPRHTVRVRRLVDYYVQLAAFADHAVMGGRWRVTPDPADLPSGTDDLEAGAAVAGVGDPFRGERLAGLEWLDRERGNLMAMQEVASLRGWHTQVWQLAETLTALFFNRRYLNDWSTSGSKGAEAAERDGQPEAAARLWCLTSRALTDLGQWGQAQVVLDRALRLGEEHGSAVLLASIWEFRGRALDLTDPIAAMAAYRRSVELNVAAKEYRGAALARFFLGRSLDRSGSHEQAVSLLEEVYQEFMHPVGEQKPDLRMAARVQVGLGVARSHLGQAESAIQALEAAIAIFAAEGLSSYEVQALEELATVLSSTGDAEGAHECLRRAGEVISRLGKNG